MLSKVTYNGIRLGEVGDFENETLKLLLMLIKNTNVQLTENALLLAIPC
jgi:hypothetical protein